MRYLILSDIHANLHALEAVLADASTVGYDATICLGDVVGYGGDPSAALHRLLTLQPAAIIRGNHDKVCAGLEPATLFNDVARIAAEWTHRTLTPDELRTVAAFPAGPQVVVDEVLAICHGAPFDEDHYIFDDEDVRRAMAASPARICLFGHTHLPAFYAQSAPVARRDAGSASREQSLPASGSVLVNVGSVGQPRDRDPRAAYGIIDVDALALECRRVPYDLAAAQQRILAAGLPAWLALRLARGQ